MCLYCRTFADARSEIIACGAMPIPQKKYDASENGGGNIINWRMSITRQPGISSSITLISDELIPRAQKRLHEAIGDIMEFGPGNGASILIYPGIASPSAIAEIAG